MKITSILLAILFLSGCGRFLRVEHSNLELKIELDKSQYEIVGDVEGEASYVWILLLNLTNNWVGDSQTYGVIEYPGILYYRSLAEQHAIYYAIMNRNKRTDVQDIDYIVAPKFDTVITGFPPFYWKQTVKVSGKGIRLKGG